MDYSSESDEDYGEDGLPISMIPYYDTKFKLAMCSLFHPKKHGFDEDSSKDIAEHYLCMETLTPYSLYIRGAHRLSQIWNSGWAYNPPRTQSLGKHPTIRNYANICQKLGHYQIEIVKIIRKPAPGNEDICILQTFWLRIFQKVYRRRLKKRKHLTQIKNLQKREIWGRQFKRFHNN